MSKRHKALIKRYVVLLAEDVDRNKFGNRSDISVCWSSSSRRTWIEMLGHLIR